MRRSLIHRFFGGLLLTGLLLATCVAFAQPSPIDSDSAAALRARLQSLKPQLDRNAFGRPLALESTEASDQLSGDIYALVDHPFASVSNALREPSAWCQVLMLHLNIKNCAVEQADGSAATLAVAIGRKFDQPLSDAHRIDFAYSVAKADAGYMNVKLNADTGPFSTRHYRIALEAAPADDDRTAIHLGYSYAYGTTARLAMKSYLATLGSGKVGFTPSGQDQGGYIGGVRGVVERNAVRYYLAIVSYLDAPDPAQREQRLEAWFDATEQYALQLHEVEKAAYLAMKRHEFQRMP